MGKGGGSQTSTSYTSSLPEYARPYYEGLMGVMEEDFGERISAGGVDAEGNLLPNRFQYQGERMALPSAEEDMAREARRAQFENPDLGYQDYSRSMMNQAAQIPGGIRDVVSGYRPESFSGDVPSRYVDPYQQAVTQGAIGTATQAYERERDLRAARETEQGGYGGYRSAVMDAIGQGQHQRNIADIYATGGLDAWQRAQQSFAMDQAAQQARGGMDIQTGQLSNQARMDLMGGLSGLGRSALDMDAAEWDLQNRRLIGLEQSGAAQRAEEQARLDLEQQTFYEQMNAPIDAASKYMSLLSGVPAGPNYTQTQTAASPGLANQLLGAATTTGGINLLAGG